MNDRTIRLILISIIVLALSAGLWAKPMSASAAPTRYYINVTTTADEFDIIGTGLGCSLREAIRSANDATSFGGCNRFLSLGGGYDTIQVPAGTYVLSDGGAGEDMDIIGDLDIRTNMIIGALDPTPPVIQGGVGFGDRLFHILSTAAVPNPSVTFNGLILTSGQSADLGGGGVYVQTNAKLVMNNCQIFTSFASGAGGYGGGIFNNGSLTLNNTTLNSNTADNLGGGIYNLGTVTLNNTSFAGNEAAEGGGLYTAAGVGTVVMNNGSINGNFAQQGGGIFSNHANITLNNVNISLNSTITGANQDGGGIYLMNSVASLTGGIIASNHSNSNGGGLYAIDSTVTMVDVVLSNNQAATGGGISFGPAPGTSSAGNLTLTGGSFTGNQAGEGAAIFENITSGTVELGSTTLSGNSTTGSGAGIFLENGLLTVENSTLSNNSAGYYGGGLYTSASTSSATLTNVTLSGNSAPLAGGGIYRSLGAVTLTNVTISGNSSTSGGGISGDALLYNTILANSPSGGNCSIAIGGVYNLSDDPTCGFGAGRDGITPILLLPLGSYGSPTRTLLPLPGSPAIDAALDAACPSTDQRGLSRAVGTHCDVGAVERQLVDYPLIYLPVVNRR